MSTELIPIGFDFRKVAIKIVGGLLVTAVTAGFGYIVHLSNEVGTLKGNHAELRALHQDTRDMLLRIEAKVDKILERHR
jgi:hypothetical protein